MIGSLTLAASLLATGWAIPQQDARSILESARQKHAERTADVQNYTITLSFRDAQGMQTPVYYERMEGGLYRVVPAGEYGQRAHDQAGYQLDEKAMMEGMAMGFDLLGPAMAKGGGDQPPMPLTGMFEDMALFARASAQAQDSIGDGRAEARQGAAAMKEFIDRAQLMGVEQIPASGDGAASEKMRDAFVLTADGLARVLGREGDAEFVMDRMSLWLDTEYYVPLRLRMEGTVRAKGQTTPLTVERLDLDYRQVGPLYQPHQQVFRISGLMAGMSEKDKKELTKALAEMEKAKAELAKLPESQRAMVMQRFGPQMEKLEQMAAGGDMVSTIDVVSIAVNEGPPTPYGTGTLTVAGPAAAEYPGALTMASESSAAAELAVSARLAGSSEARIGLVGAGLYPEAGGSVAITGAKGVAELDGNPAVMIDGGNGTITVSDRTPTRISGTFEATLTGTHDTGAGPAAVQFTVSGTFETAAPTGPYRAPAGSPFQPDMFGSR